MHNRQHYIKRVCGRCWWVSTGYLTQNDLGGCVNDVGAVRTLLANNYGVPDDRMSPTSSGKETGLVSKLCHMGTRQLLAAT
jgi:hypothetical protein